MVKKICLSLLVSTLFLTNVNHLNASTEKKHSVMYNNGSKVIEVTNYDGIVVNSIFNVTVLDKPLDNKVVIDAPARVLEFINAKVVDNKLILELKNNKSLKLKNDEKINVTINHQHLKRINTSGASKISVDFPIVENKLEITSTGASNVFLKTDVKILLVNTSGASKVEVKGTVDKLILENSGAANFKGNNLKVNNASVTSSGASKTDVWAIDQLVVNASGASKVSYKSQENLDEILKTSGVSNISKN